MDSLSTQGGGKCRCHHVGVRFPTKCLLNFRYTLVLFFLGECVTRKTACVCSLLNLWRLHRMTRSLGIVQFHVTNINWVLLWCVKKPNKPCSVGVKQPQRVISGGAYYGLFARFHSFPKISPVKLRDPHALSLPFTKCTLQRWPFFETAFLMRCCCCCCYCCWSFQPYAVLSHIIPLWLWWQHWCGLLLLGSLSSCSPMRMWCFFFISRLYTITGKWGWRMQQLQSRCNALLYVV